MEIENICVCVIQGHLCVYYKHCVGISVFCYFSVGAGQVVYFVSGCIPWTTPPFICVHA